MREKRSERRRIGVMLFLFCGLLFGRILYHAIDPDSAESAAVPTIPDMGMAGYLPLILTDQITPTPSCLPSPPVASSDPANEARIAAGLNFQRNQAGVPSLSWNGSIEQASRRHSRDMALHNLTSHIGTDGSDAGTRMREACYTWQQWGEIIGWGFGGSTDAMINWWLNSPAHHAVILSSAYSDFGVGYIVQPGSEWGHYWTVDFGRTATIHTTELPYLCRYTTIGAEGGSILTYLSAEPCPE